VDRQHTTSIIHSALDDIRVVEIGQYVSGPYCSRLLADYGANVMKIEPPLLGDPARRIGPFPDDIPNGEKSGIFLLLNMNKKGLTVDITTDRGSKLVKELVKTADVLIENFSPGYLSHYGLGYDQLEKINPALVMTSITPYGSTGPYRAYKASEINVFAMSGRMSPPGLADREPVRYAPDASWFQAGCTAVVPTLGAVYLSKLSGVGQHIDVSAMETHIGNVDNRLLHYEYTGDEVERGYWLGGFPVGAYPCKDGYVVFGIVYERFFERLCHAMGRPDILDDPRFALASRDENIEELEIILLEWTMQHTQLELFDICQKARVLCGPLYQPSDLLNDPQLNSRSYFVKSEHPEAGILTYPGATFIMSKTPYEFRYPAPTLGQHNVEVYSDLGYTNKEIDYLVSAGVV